MKQTEKKYQCLPFWSWNDELDEEGLVKQLEWMNDNGVGGFFMHARGGLKTEYLGEQWFKCIKSCAEKAEELGMEAYAYDENGWPSGFVGGKLLEDIENHDRYLTMTIGKYDEKAMVSYSLDGDALVRVTQGENCLNVYQHYATSTADILNGEVVDKFIALTHEEYKKRDTYNLKGFFTDEPQYQRWGLPYTKVLSAYFEKEYGEDILEGIGLLFVEKKGYRAFRYKYWKAMQALMLENFAKKVYDWCDSNGYKLTGHYVEETYLGAQMWACAGIMPFYEYEHIPGIDYLGRPVANLIASRQVSSVAAQLGKKQIMTETYGCCGWDVTPKELKAIAECQYVGGVNLMCQHLLPYTEHGQRKRDYPAHYSEANPWVRKNFKEFNNYFSVLGKTISESEDIVNVAVLHPIRSAYFDYKRFEPNHNIPDLEIGFFWTTETLTKKQIPFHYLDETLLAKYGKVEGKKITLGNCSYDYLILPRMYTMDKTTEKLLQEYVKAGGKVLLAFEKPTYLEGEEYAYDYLETNTTWEEIISAQPYTTEEHSTVRTLLRKDETGRKFIYAVNLGEETTLHFNLKNATSFSAYDIFKDEYKTVSTDVHFKDGQSYILYFSDEKPETQKQLSPLRLKEEFTVCGDVENYLTLDFARYSTDGVSYGESLHTMGILQELLKQRYQGKVYLKYEFDVEDIPSKCELLAEDSNTVYVEINGEKVSSCGCSEVEKALLKYDIARKLKTGKNEAVVVLNYFQSEDVYYALFGENVTESLKNCLVYDTDIEAVYLKGNFGVKGEFEQGKTEDILLGQNFRIVKQKKQIRSLIEEGYPFFAGNITLKQTVAVEDTQSELIIDKRFHLLDVKVNGKEAGRMMFDNRLDLSDVLKVGENELELTLTVGNRNLLGPFHYTDQECLWLCPDTFERAGTWTDGKSSNFNDKYAFIKTLL